MRLALLLALAVLAHAGSAIAADEDRDLDLIPRAAPPAARAAAAPAAAFSGNERVFVEDALGFTSLRDGLLVPFPRPIAPRWEERLFADTRLQWPIGSSAFVAYSGRLNLVGEEHLGFANRGNVTNDLRELYASVEPRPRDYLDAGRINVKSGVALGFNPTDFFKARAVVDPLTADPSALREDRLGTLMVRVQHLGDLGSIAAMYAPRVTGPAPLSADPWRGFSPLFGLTNSSERWLAKGSVRLGDDVNPEMLLFRGNGEWKLGANLAESIGKRTVVYVEWSGGRRLAIADEALGRGGEKRFRNQVAVGASYTTESRITWNLEYHYNEAGFSRVGSLPATPELWLTRGYASDRQEPMQRHSVFLRADWIDFLVPKLELTGFVLADAQDGSALMQVSADYAHTDLWSFGVTAGGTTGGRRSNFGSLPREASVLLRARRYL